MQELADKISELCHGNFEFSDGRFKLEPSELLEFCRFLKRTDGLYFDQLACITGMHNHKEQTFDVIYNLSSIPYNYQIELLVNVSEESPVVPSLVELWKAADWLERETFDLFGIRFENHPDLRRILLPANWEGYPLRKDYKTQEYYHGIKVDY